MTACTVSDCSSTAGSGGGGLSSGTLHLLNCTLSGNTCTGISVSGGGLAVAADESREADALATVIHCTVTSNTVTGGSGGGIGVTSDGLATATLEIKNSIVAGNTGLTDDLQDNGAIDSGGHNVIGHPAGHGITNGTNGDRVGTILNPIDPGLGPLTAGLGPTPVHPLLAGSPAAGIVPEANCTDRLGDPVTEDQTGASRPAGFCAAGAVED